MIPLQLLLRLFPIATSFHHFSLHASSFLFTLFVLFPLLSMLPYFRHLLSMPSVSLVNSFLCDPSQPSPSTLFLTVIFLGSFFLLTSLSLFHALPFLILDQNSIFPRSLLSVHFSINMLISSRK